MIASGVFDGARCYVFATSWAAPVVDEEPLIASILGKTTISDDRYVIENMGLLDALNQTVGITVTATCRHAFGSAGCGKDLGPLTVTGTLTHVTDSYTVRDSARAEADDYFGAGTIAFTSGPNMGLRPIQIWVPDTRTPGFAKEARRQSLALANSPREAEDQAFIDAISAPFDA